MNTFSFPLKNNLENHLSKASSPLMDKEARKQNHTSPANHRAISPDPCLKRREPHSSNYHIQRSPHTHVYIAHLDAQSPPQQHDPISKSTALSKVKLQPLCFDRSAGFIDVSDNARELELAHSIVVAQLFPLRFQP